MPVGAPGDRRLEIAGGDLPGTGSATELVAWINGHPGFGAAVWSGSRTGGGDRQRQRRPRRRTHLTADPQSLARTDISDAALQALRASSIREVVVAARRDRWTPRSPARTHRPHGYRRGWSSTRTTTRWCAAISNTRDAATHKARNPVSASRAAILSTRPRIRLAYRLTPQRILGGERAQAVRLTRTATQDTVTLDAGLVLTSMVTALRRFRACRSTTGPPWCPTGRGEWSTPTAFPSATPTSPLDQTRADGIHRHQQVLRDADRRRDRRRLQRRTARRSPQRTGSMAKLGARQPDLVDSQGVGRDPAEIVRGQAAAGRG